MSRGLFIAGTSTEVGKTRIAKMIARALVAQGVSVGVYKPAASGCRVVEGEIVSDDAIDIWNAAGRPGKLDEVCPQRFLKSLAPHLAAAAEGRRVDERLLRDGVRPWLARSEIVLVEGAGGLMSPLGEATYNVTLAAEIGLPIVIVVANRLGAINDALQTLITARAKAPHVPIAGFVLNHSQLRPGDESLTTNAAELERRCNTPLLATVDYDADAFDRPVDWKSLAAPATMLC